MARNNIDYSKSGQNQKAQKFNKHQLLRKLNNLNGKDRQRLQTELFDSDAQYDETTIESANRLLDLLNDSGINYQLIARNDGGGLLARAKGLGGNDLTITVAPKDTLRFNRKTKKQELTSSERFVGNINANGRNYYVDRKSEMKKSIDQYIKKNNIERNSDEWKKVWRQYFNDERVKQFEEKRIEYIVKGLTGQIPVKTTYFKGENRKDNNYDHAHTIMDEQGRPIVNFYRRKVSEDFERNIEDFITHYNSLKEENVEDVEATPLKQMIKETNELINAERNEEGEITRNVKGFQETEVFEPITLNNDTDYSGLDLDTLLAFQDRRDIARAIAFEMRENDAFSLNNAEIKGEEGLKDLLMEETAGVKAKAVTPGELADSEEHIKKYEDLLVHTETLLKRQGLSNINVYYDEDHVIHWEGTNSSNGEEIKRTGEIGQIFLPNESGLIETGFKTIEGSEDRNYNMIVGYTAYYQSDYRKTTLKPRTMTIEDDNGNYLDVVASTDKDDNGNPIPFQTKKGKFLRAERFPEDEIVRLNARIDDYNAKHKDNPLAKVDTVEVERTLRDRLRLRGYEQSLNQQLEATVARQVLQDTSHSIDNTSLNKLYHGDVYGMRISESNKNNAAIVETYNNRVKFDDDVLFKSINELDSSFESDKDEEYDGEDYSHRFNIQELDGIFDRSVSTDGANLGLVRYLTKGTQVLDTTGEIVPSMEGITGRARIIDDMPFSEADPGDRSMMGANQYMKSRNVEKSVVALMTYKGYTFEDGAVVSEKFAEQQGEIVNGYDEDGNVKPLQIGDKISDMHGNKATISYIASSEDDVFKENPSLDVIMNPHSIPSRMNTGVPLEMIDNGVSLEIKHKGQKVADAGLLNVVITDITAKDKTKVYEDEFDKDGNLIKKSVRKGRSFGVQEAWVANALGLDATMKEVYQNNTEPFEKMKAYLNVTGLDFDEDTIMIQSNGFNNGKEAPSENIEKIDIKDGIELPKDGGYMELPIEVELPSGVKTRYINVMPEKYRNTQELFDGDRMYHDYSTAYNRIAKSALKYDEIAKKYKVQLQESIEHLKDQDLSQIDLTNDDERIKLRKLLTNEDDIKEFDQAIKGLKEGQKQQSKEIQGKVNSLTTRIIDDKLGGRSNLSERLDEYGDAHMYRSKDTKAIKQSIMKKEIMSKQVPNSVTSVVTAEPNVDIDTIKVSPEIYSKLDVKSHDERVLLWRDPALHDGSMRAFKVEKDNDIKGVGINPLVTESFGMDFDGDTVGVYAPKTKEAQQELQDKAALEKNLIDPTSKEFTGNIGMDFVSSAYENGYIRDSDNTITQGPLLGRDQEILDENGEYIKPKDQLQFILNEMAHKTDGHKEINQLWKDVVTNEKNIATSKVDFISRDSFKDSVMRMAEKGAKGKPDGIENSEIAERIKQKEEELGRKMTYRERMDDPDKYIGDQSTVMDYYDRGSEMVELKRKYQIQGSMPYLEDYKMLYSPYIFNEDGEKVRNKGSLGYDQDKTRMAQSGKTDLTGLAGAKSQTLVGLMYDKEGGAMAAMEVTEPLTQATLKLKHDPNQTPKIKKLLEDYDGMLSNGGYSQSEFKQEFRAMYDDVGLDVRDEHLDAVFDTLSNGDKENPQTLPIQEVIETKMNPIMKANLYGYDAMRESATGIEKNTQVDKNMYEIKVLDNDNKWVTKDETGKTNQPKSNMQMLRNIALGKEEANKSDLMTFKSGVKSNVHVPQGLEHVTISSRKQVADTFARNHQCGKYNQEPVKFRQERDYEQQIDKGNEKSAESSANSLGMIAPHSNQLDNSKELKEQKDSEGIQMEM